VEEILSQTPPDSNRYDILSEIELDFDANVPLVVRNSNTTTVGEPRKKIKRESEESN
jgi:hypothetical protein